MIERRTPICGAKSWYYAEGQQVFDEKSGTWEFPPDVPAWSTHLCERELSHRGLHKCSCETEWDVPELPPTPAKAELQRQMRRIIGRQLLPHERHREYRKHIKR